MWFIVAMGTGMVTAFGGVMFLPWWGFAICLAVFVLAISMRAYIFNLMIEVLD
jgi:hypothetical protein